MHILHLCFSPPGSVKAWKALTSAIAVMCILCVADLLTPADVRLHVLYIFPLVAIAYHCSAVWMQALGLALSSTFQCLTFIVQHDSARALATDAFVTVASCVLGIALARQLRSSYLTLLQLAETDALTGLYNRRRFHATVDAEISRQNRCPGIFSLVAIDLDHFKHLNDTRGHDAGDQALRRLAKILTENRRKTDTVARIGGDEFAILMPQIDAPSCHFACEQLGRRIDKEMLENGFRITASLGHATFSAPPADTSVALHAADKAMYVSKHANRRR